jgi:transposase
VLAAMKNVRIRASIDEIAKSLQGNWRAEHLFALKQALAAVRLLSARNWSECDREIEAQLKRLAVHEGTPPKARSEAVPRNAPKVRPAGATVQDVRGGSDAYRRHRRHHGAGGHSEVGADMSRFPTVKHFASWLGLCPGTKITGGKVMSGKTKRCANRAAQALRLAAAALRTSQSALGRTFRRMCSRMDKPKAVTAAAHKLARLIYTMLTKGEEYTDQGQDYFEEGGCFLRGVLLRNTSVNSRFIPRTILLTHIHDFGG